MKKRLSLLLFLGSCSINQGILLNPASAQSITSDDTLPTPTKVTENGNVTEIRGGTAEGSNLFHSFQDFSVLPGNEASFLNADGISNIFSRVTGGNESLIDGLIRTNNASLFFLNPAGIIFGPGATLNLGSGSFYGSTADSLLFEDGEFIATNTDNRPILTVKAPISLNLRDNPENIVNRSAGLQVATGENITLVGGNVDLEGGSIFAPGGRVELGGLSAAGEIGINADGSLSFPDGIPRAHITLTQKGRVSASTFPGGENSGENAGEINLTTANLSLTQGSVVDANTLGEGNVEGDTGAITIDASESISVEGANSSILSQVGADTVGNAGEINLTTNNLSLTEGGVVTTSTFGRGDAGAIIIDASGTISADGAAAQTGFQSGIFSSVGADAAGNVGEGNAGEINLTTTNLSLTEGGVVTTSTSGRGDAGAITIDASGTISADGAAAQTGFQSGVFSSVGADAEGNADDVTITTGNLNFSNGGQVNVSAFGKGNAGSLTVQANSVSLDNNSSIEASTQSGTGGIINLRITEDLILNNNSFISARAFQKADGGNLNIDARFIIAFPDGNSDILASAEQGRGGNITISAESLFGIQERTPSDSTNDIDASSEFSLDGNVTINTPDINPLQGVTELPSNVVEPEQTVAQACRRDHISGKTTGLAIKGKGGIPVQPIEPMDSDTILVRGQTTTQNLQSNYPEIKPIKTDDGDIYPARGVIKTEDGRIILTAYPTEGINNRNPQISPNCNPS